MKTNKVKTGESYLHIVRESATITCFFAETKREK